MVSGRWRGAVAVASLLLTAACSPVWHRLATPRPLTPDRTKRVQVWSHGSHVDHWYAVIVSSDSITGIPYDTSPEASFSPLDPPRPEPGCKGCRRSLPLADVDSIRLGSVNPAFYGFAVVGGIAFIGWLIAEVHNPH